MTRIPISLRRLAGRVLSCRNALNFTAIFALYLSSGNSGFAQAERVLGLDVSYWNRGSSSATANGITQTAWNTAYNTPNANGYRRYFAWVRATRGGTTGLGQTSGTPSPGGTQETLTRRYDDPEFLRTMTRATAAGLFAGPYHYGRPDIAGNTGTDEADHFIEFASAYMRPGYLMPVYDWEEDGTSVDASAQFAIDFSNRIYSRMQIRPAVYIGGARSGTIESATQSRQDQLAKPGPFNPGFTGPAYPMLWNPLYANNADPESIDVQTDNPKAHYSGFYGPWDDYGNTQPWSFWQYASTVSIPGINSVDSTADGNVSHGDIEYVKNYLVPAIWWNDASGDWGTLANWNSGQPLSTFNANDLNNPPAPYSPHVGSGQTTPFTTYSLPVPRLPGAAGSGSTSGQHDTVIIERPNANISVTLSSGSYNIRKLYMRELLNITGGSLTVNYDPTYRPDASTFVLHGGPISAQFSGPVSLSGSGALTVHTLRVDTNRTFTVGGGTLTFSRMNLMPHTTLPAKLAINGNATFNPRSNVMALIAKGSGAGNSGLVDLMAGTRTISVGNGTNDIDLSIEVPISNGGLVKAGAGTLRLTIANGYAGGTTVSGGRLLVNNVSGSGTGSGAVSVTAGILGGSGLISGPVTVASGGTISPGNSIGTLTLNSAPVLGGTVAMEIDRNGGAPLADKLVVASGTLNFGGTLVVSNLGAPLVGGEIFTLFSAGSYNGEFANTVLPALNAGLNWDLSKLAVNGTIKVNRGPTVSALSVTNNFPGVLQIPVSSFSNGSDPDGDTLSLFSFSISTNGVTLTSDGTNLSYSNAANVPDQFDFVVTDQHGGFATNSVNISTNTVITGEFVQHPSANGGSITLHFSGTPGVTYYVDRSTNLPPSWLTIWTNVAPPSGLFDYTDEFNDLTQPPPSAFYRLRW